MKLFKNLESLTLTQRNLLRDPTSKDYQPKWEQLTSLTRLKSLKTEWDMKCSLIRQVACTTDYLLHNLASSLASCGQDESFLRVFEGEIICLQ